MGYTDDASSDADSEGGARPRPCVVWTLGVLTGLIFVIVMLAGSLKRVQETEIALAYNPIEKKLGEDVYSVGLHAGSPFFRFIKFPSVYTTLYYEDEKCVSKDGIMVTLKLDVQYQVDQGRVRDLVAQYSTAEKHVKILYWAIQSGVHNTCSQFLITEFQEERGRVQDSLLAKCRAKAESLMTQVIDVQLQNIDIPGEYTMAIESKERAREDINLAYNERAQLVYEGERRRQESEQDILIMMLNANKTRDVTLAKATAQGEAAENMLKKEATAYKGVQQELGLDTPGLISYLSTRAIEANDDPDVNIARPAKGSFAGR